EGLLALPWGPRCAAILGHLLGDEYGREELEAASAAALDFPVPLVPAGRGLHALELFHGPTLAFKDFGARFLARMLALEGTRERLVLTATSGDTGAAVASAFHGVAGFRAVVLYPAGRVTPLQERQFAALGGNVLALAVRGSFDDCQALAKGAFADAELVRRLGLASANSINIARVLAQVLYYFEAVAALRGAGRGTPPVVAVPSGNFGNLYAGLLARRLGLPLKALVAATNANRTVPDHLDTGEYRPRPSLATLSNAMDVGSPSNWERVLALHAGDLEALRRALRWGSAGDEATLESLRALRDGGYLADPHAAVAAAVLRERLRPGEVGVFLGTAHPAKFREILEEGLGIRVDLPPALARLERLPILAEPLEPELGALKARLGA
ncbi:MAG TPA: threonine synthase, partial [Holophaga sp.]|nr:threonine synthase [Holophaga sp.]